jgi:hypothetical protein
VATALFMSYNGGFGIKTDIIQINLWNRRTNGLTLIQKACAFYPGYPQD